VWSGCLYLCDFIICQQHIFDKAVVLELGAGVGLASIVASMFADRILVTGFILSEMYYKINQWLAQYLSKTLCKFNVLCAQANSVILVMAREKERHM